MFPKILLLWIGLHLVGCNSTLDAEVSNAESSSTDVQAEQNGNDAPPPKPEPKKELKNNDDESDDESGNDDGLGDGIDPVTDAPNATPAPEITDITAVAAFAEVTLSWTSGGSGTGGYLVNQAAGAEAPADCVGGTETSETNIVVSGLTPGSMHAFRVCAVASSLSSLVTTGLAITTTTKSPEITLITPTSGLTTGGAPIVITGTNLDLIASLTFDGVECTGLTIDSSTQLSCLTPTHAAGTVDVTVVMPGFENTLTNAYNYLVPVDPPGNVNSYATRLTTYLSWDEKPGATYDVYWNTTGPVTTTDTKVAGATSPFLHPSLTPGQTYNYAIVATEGGRESVLSLEVSNQVPALYYVDATRPDDTGDGSVSQPKKTIQAAIDAAVPPADILVRQGTYGIIQMRDDISVYGGYKIDDWNDNDFDTYTTTIVDTRTSTTPAYATVAVDFTSLDSKIFFEGFSIQGLTLNTGAIADTGAMIGLLNSHQITIRNNTLVGGGCANATLLLNGIYIVTADRLLIENNSIFTGSILSSLGSSALQASGLSNSVIRDNTIKGAEHLAQLLTRGINFTGTHTNTQVYGNFILGGSTNGNYNGNYMGVLMLMSDGSSIDFYNNVVFGGQYPDTGAYAHAISLTIGDAGTVNIRNNTLYGGDAAGRTKVVTITSTGAGAFINIDNNIIMNGGGGSSSDLCFTGAAQTNITSLQNNNLYGCEEAMFESETTVDGVNSYGFASGNVSFAVTPTDIVNGDAFLAGSPDKDVIQGGLDGQALGWNFSNDFDKNPRTNAIPDGPTNTNAGGWSMGAIEHD